MDLSSASIDWWRRRRWTRPRISTVRHFASMADVPASLPRHELVLIGAPDRLKWALFECPCGNGHRLVVNLDAVRTPKWTIALTPRPTLSPSVDVRDRRRCHFLLQEGRVRWVHDA
jgi:hypothetical protein